MTIDEIVKEGLTVFGNLGSWAAHDAESLVATLVGYTTSTLRHLERPAPPVATRDQVMMALIRELGQRMIGK